MNTAAITEITEQALQARLAAGERFEFWNVLTDEYFAGEMIPGSRHVPLDTVGREVSESGLDKATEVVVYCSGGACKQSVEAAGKLATLGYTKVSVFEGGLEAWKQAGFVVETA